MYFPNIDFLFFDRVSLGVYASDVHTHTLSAITDSTMSTHSIQSKFIKSFTGNINLKQERLNYLKR